jgi:hypothetical protein
MFLNNCIKAFLSTYVMFVFTLAPLLSSYYIEEYDLFSLRSCCFFDIQGFVGYLYFTTLIFNLFLIPFISLIYLTIFDFIRNSKYAKTYVIATFPFLFLLSFIFNPFWLIIWDRSHKDSVNFYPLIVTLAISKLTIALILTGTVLVLDRIDATKKIYRIAGFMAFCLSFSFLIFCYVDYTTPGLK